MRFISFMWREREKEIEQWMALKANSIETKLSERRVVIG